MKKGPQWLSVRAPHPHILWLSKSMWLILTKSGQLLWVPITDETFFLSLAGKPSIVTPKGRWDLLCARKVLSLTGKPSIVTPKGSGGVRGPHSECPTPLVIPNYKSVLLGPREVLKDCHSKGSLLLWLQMGNDGVRDPHSECPTPLVIPNCKSASPSWCKRGPERLCHSKGNLLLWLQIGSGGVRDPHSECPTSLVIPDYKCKLLGAREVLKDCHLESHAPLVTPNV